MSADVLSASCRCHRRIVPLGLCTLAAAGCATTPQSTPDQRAPTTATTAAAGERASSDHGPHDSLADFLDSHFSSQAWHDDVGCGYFCSSSVLLPAGLALGAGAIAPWDHTISNHAKGSSPTLGDVTLATLVAGTAAIGVFAPGDGRAASEERWTIGETYALTIGTTSALKSIVGRGRPDSSSNTSFPSGHASAAFAAATLIDRNSGHGLGVPAYALAAVTAVSRVEARRHFPSDVLAGGALGALCAGVVDSLHFGGDQEGHGISRRRSAVQVGLDTGSNGRPELVLILGF